jgi:hypothetical protein
MMNLISPKQWKRKTFSTYLKETSGVKHLKHVFFFSFISQGFMPRRQEINQLNCRKQHKAKFVKVAGREETRIEEKIKHLKNTLRKEEKP